MHLSPYPHWSRFYRDAVNNNIGVGKMERDFVTIVFKTQTLRQYVDTHIYWANNCAVCITRIIPLEAIHSIVAQNRQQAYNVFHSEGATQAPVGYLESRSDYVCLKNALSYSTSAASSREVPNVCCIATPKDASSESVDPVRAQQSFFFCKGHDVHGLSCNKKLQCGWQECPWCSTWYFYDDEHVKDRIASRALLALIEQEAGPEVMIKQLRKEARKAGESAMSHSSQMVKWANSIKSHIMMWPRSANDEEIKWRMEKAKKGCSPVNRWPFHQAPWVPATVTQAHPDGPLIMMAQDVV